MGNAFSRIFEMIKKFDGKTLERKHFRDLKEFIERKLNRYNIFEIVDKFEKVFEKFVEEILFNFILNDEYNLYEIYEKGNNCRIIAAENFEDKKIIILCFSENTIEMKIFSDKPIKAYIEH